MNLYDKYHRSRQDERRGLFEIAREEFGVDRGLYPGSFVHVTPSFYLSRMNYVDSDANAARFFRAGLAAELVTQEKLYECEPEITFLHEDYTNPLPLVEESFDLLISQYGGPVSEHCKRYLRPGGILIANNSHSDAGLARNDDDFELVGVIHRQGTRFTLSIEGLDAYFVPKTKKLPEDKAARRAYLMELGRGVGYVKSAADYVFRKVARSHAIAQAKR
jgi:SAM-dependent methyltransferase